MEVREKIQHNTGNKVYLVSSSSWTDDTEVLAVTATKEDAEKAKAYYGGSKSAIFITEKEITTYDDMKFLYSYSITVDVKEKEPGVYVMGKDYWIRREYPYIELYESDEKASFSMTHEFDDFRNPADKDITARLEITTAEEAPTGMKESREWIRDKIKQFGITIQVPYSETN